MYSEFRPITEDWRYGASEWFDRDGESRETADVGELMFICRKLNLAISGL